MPANTGFNPTNLNQYEKSKLNKDADAAEATLTPGASSNLDVLILDDCLILSSVLLVSGAAKGDYWKMQVVHPVAGVVFEPIHKWYVDHTSTNQPIPKANFPAKVFAGLTIRIVYVSVGTDPVWIAFNLDKDKVLE